MISLSRGAGRKLLWWGLAALGLLVGLVSTRVCVSTGLRFGLWLSECPDGDVRPVVAVSSTLSRGAESTVSVSLSAAYTAGPADQQRSEPMATFSSRLFVVGPGGEQELVPKKGWDASNATHQALVTLPGLSDGDYVLRVKVSSSIGDASLDAPLPLYAPARVHVLTDRPLYEPGHTVQFRAVVLHAATLAPLDGRPGVWRVTNPKGEVLMEERAPAQDFGVVAGTFPLDSQAESGEWEVSWASGAVTQTRSFTVKPFTLPRFRIEANPAKAFYRRHERPIVNGTVLSSSGAPVPNAKIDVSWSTSGPWPPPTSWKDQSALPKVATTNALGRFNLELPEVPDDLRHQAHVIGALSATDAAGDRVEGAVDVLLSEDPVLVSAVSELRDDGLVPGFNNRLYLRATRADGQVLSNTDLLVKRLWEPTDPGISARTDEDGVASLQIDPGAPVTVVIPPLPFRPPPKTDPVVRTRLDDRLHEEDDVSLPDRLSFDRIETSLSSCAKYVDQKSDAVTVGVLVHASGAIAAVAAPATKLGRCVKKQLETMRFSSGSERLFESTFELNDEELPTLIAQVESSPEALPRVSEAIADALVDARDCLPATVQSGPLQRVATWRFEPGQKQVALTFAPLKNGGRVPEGALTCIATRLGTITLPAHESDEERMTEMSAVGYVTFEVDAPQKYESERPQETIMEGYEFLVTASAHNEVLGSTKVRLKPGEIPNVRLRASSQLVRPGDVVTISLLRGPEWSGKLPEALWLRQGVRSWESRFDETSKSSQFTMPTDVEGWFSVQFEEAEVFLYSQPKASLSISIVSEKPRYAPGQLARLDIDTRSNGIGHTAAVGLFGVDESLAQLTPLPGSTELDGMRPAVLSQQAFPGIDALALSQGRIRGSHAQAATLLKVAQLPRSVELDTPASVSAQTTVDANAVLVDRFYAALQELYVQTRDWESTAAQSEKMTPQTMARLWSRSLDALEQRKESSRDVWGRRLRLHRLPRDLFALTEPRQVIVDGTRLPEDSENWAIWVAKEKP